MSSEEQSVEQQSGDYEFVTYETLDEGRIARIMLNRPEARNAQNRGMLVELNEAFLRGRGRRRGAGRDPRRHGPDVLLRPRHGLEGGDGGADATPPDPDINGGTREGAENLMLQEWHYYFENTRRWRNLRKITVAQVHGDVYAAGLMLMWACDLIVAAEATSPSPTWSAPASACAASSTSPTRGSSGPARPRSSCSPATRLSVDEAHALGMVSKVFPADELGDTHPRVRPAHRPAAHHDRPADQGVGQPDRRQHGLLQRAQRLLHAPRAQPLATGPRSTRRVPDRPGGGRHPQLEGRRRRSSRR